MPGRVEGKVAIVVGAGCIGPGWGNGRAAAVLFAREGAKVFAVDKDADAMTETVARVGNDGEIATHVCDVLDDAQVAAMTEACRKKFGGNIDILVNNVGGSAAGGAAEMSEEVFDKQIDYNLKSVFLSCRHVIPVMIEQGGGAIVNTSSSSGIRFTGSPQIGYASSKAAVIQFSRVTAVQYASNGIRVNTVVPGQMHTPMVEARLAKQRTGGDIEALLKSRVARIPLGFMGDGRDTANAVLFLASDEARFITGTEIVVDGGMTVRCDCSISQTRCSASRRKISRNNSMAIRADDLTPTIPPPDPNPKKPRFTLPPLACDSHFHVFGPHGKFPYAPNRPFTPTDAPKEDLFRLHEFLGFQRGVFVQSTCHGSDHAALVDLLAAGKGRYRGVALLEPTMRPEESRAPR